MTDHQRRELAEAVREACVRAMLAGYEQASISGLCGEGAFEVAVDAVRRLELEPVIEALDGERRSR